MPTTVDQYTVKIEGARLSYPNLHEKRGFRTGEGKPAYSATALMDKKACAASIKKIQDIIALLTKEEFGGKPLPPDRVCLKDGSLKDGTDGYGDGVMFVAARNEQTKPFVVDRDPRVQLTAESGRPYAGCYVNMVIRFWAQGGKTNPSQFGKRINASLGNVQFVRDGAPFGVTATPPEEDFSPVPDDDPV